jgi:hypothetical protein
MQIASFSDGPFSSRNSVGCEHRSAFEQPPEGELECRICTQMILTVRFVIAPTGSYARSVPYATLTARKRDAS